MNPDSLPNPMILAHRGDSAHAPENTLPAFLLARDHQADGIELDAKLTADGEVVVIHDPTVERTTQGSGRVREMTLAELRKLDAGEKFAPQFKGTQIPLLSEVFAAVGGALLVNVELTDYDTPDDDLPEKVAGLVRQFHLEEQVIFSSFHPLPLRRARKALPEGFQGLLALPGGKGRLPRSSLNRFIPLEALHPYFTDVSARLVERCHQRGLRVHPWTVDSPEEMEKLFRLQVDGVITDDPLLARQTLAAHQTKGSM